MDTLEAPADFTILLLLASGHTRALANIEHMKILAPISLILISTGMCYGQNWSMIKDTVAPTIELTAEYDSIYQQPLSSLGWEDGIHISDDGLHLYCTYLPIDFLSFILNGDLPTNYSANYLRGAPDYGMDLVTNPIAASEWIHADILYSSRSSISEPFTTWQLSNMARPIYSEGAPTPFSQDSFNSIQYMLFTSIDNPTNNQDIWVIQNTPANPAGTGFPLPSPVNTIYNEDNPHLTRIGGDTLLLFYDSNNLPGGMGGIDLWYTTSYDNGLNWNSPTNVSSINTSSTEHQPFIFYDNSKAKFYMYYSAYHTDNKLAIFRKEQLFKNDWNSWGDTELVISAGNSAGIGEPTLTESGDMSFVVVYEDPELNSVYNRFDADPWYLRKKNTIVTLDTQANIQNVEAYPNPSNGFVYFNSQNNITSIRIFDNKGTMIYEGIDEILDIKDFPNGIYHLSIITNLGNSVSQLLIKK
ncbi:T9SS type A sorting domain-containing protein [Reichenbachiella agariperforans]|uniref:T9SS type A sorting domain-containing protein n=1 Tax=Reichenbachiella agariperforans TaxID=156994 RepID=UPI001C09C228|nr:T9SS type A sorting domain-containing protein [Reichenbachiella agariperforans]MBU2913938.1 T9SS type A sorting domain-containing protein [Reichenbachiella agariperforans]